MVEALAGNRRKVNIKEGLENGVPEHIAIIPDGNRRWAKDVGLPIATGYQEGAKRIAEVATEASCLGIRNLTFWIVSPDNIVKRDPSELETWYKAMRRELIYTAVPDLIRKGLRIKTLGNLDREKVPGDIVDDLARFQEESQDNSGMTLTLAVNYDGKTEFSEALRRFVDAEETSFDQETFNTYLQSRRIGLPDPEWVIRTSQVHRSSGFMPLQTQNSDYDFPRVKWPDFTTHEFRKSVQRFGGVNKTLGG